MAVLGHSVALSAAKKKVMADEWLKLAAQAYPARTAEMLLARDAPFRNPAGDALRRNLPVLVDAALGDAAFEAAAPALDELLRIRAVQFGTATEAVSIIFLLKPVVRRHLGLDKLVEDRIDRLALMASDAWARCREALESIQANERRRREFLSERMRRS